MEFWNFKNPQEGEELKKIADTALEQKEQENFAKSPRDAADGIDDQERQIAADAEFFNKDLEQYAVYGEEVERRLESEHDKIKFLEDQIKKLDQKTDYLLTNSDIHDAFNGREDLRDEIKEYRTSVTHKNFGNTERLEQDPSYQLLIQKFKGASEIYEMLKKQDPIERYAKIKGLKKEMEELNVRLDKLVQIYGASDRDSSNN